MTRLFTARDARLEKADLEDRSLEKERKHLARQYRRMAAIAKRHGWEEMAIRHAARAEDVEAGRPPRRR